MKIDEHQLLIAPLQRHPLHQQASLELRNAHRPGVCARQRNALCFQRAEGTKRQQTGLNLADRRQRKRHILAGIIHGKSVRPANEAGKRRSLIHKIGAF